MLFISGLDKMIATHDSATVYFTLINVATEHINIALMVKLNKVHSLLQTSDICRPEE